MSDGPYAQASMAYLRTGWSPLPLPEGEKSPPPTDWTGYAAHYPSAADVTEWALNGKGAGNICIRLPDGVIGVDVDAYGEKRGAETLAEAVARLGPLPATYTSSARGYGVSGIRLYRVRRRRRIWADVVGPDVEVIHYGHRYMLVAPSVHPSGAIYHWYTPGGMACGMPALEDIPWLPEKWEDSLDRGDISERATKAAVDLSAALSALQGYPDGPMCEVLLRIVGQARNELPVAGSRHDAVRPLVAAAVRAGERGHNGSAEALVEINRVWLEALASGEKRVPDAGEFERMVMGAVAIVTDDPTPAADVGCCGSSLAPAFSFDPTGEAAFWSARAELSCIYQTSRAQMVAPWAVLVACLVRVTTAIPPHVRLPALIGGEASLNMFAALIGESGAGKGGVEAVAASCIVLPEIHQANVGSGEGITHLYKRRNRQGVLEPIRDAVLFSVSEIDTLTALGQRQGSTLLSQLRKAWMGEHLGFSNADQTRTVPLKAHGYRMGLILGVQPGRSGALIRDGDGGTPQRFIYAWVTDPTTPWPDDRPARPEPYAWELHEKLWPATDRLPYVDVTVCDEVTAAVLENRYHQTQGDGHALDGHLMLCRLKVAAALGILNGRLSVTPDDWALSAVVMDHSTGVRNELERYLDSKATESNLARGRADAHRQLATEEVLTDAKVARVGRTVMRVLGKATEELTLRGMRALVTSSDRGVITEAVEALVKAGQVQETNRDGKVYYSVVVKTDK